jgi:hypothetical protein
MRARIAFPLLTILVLAAADSPRSAAAGAWGLQKGEWYANLEGSNFVSDTYLSDAGGVRTDSGLVVEERALRSEIELGFRRHTTLLFGLPSLSSTHRDARVEGTATGFQDAKLGLKYSFGGKRVGLDASAATLTWTGPSGYNRKLDSLGIELGEGLQELAAGLELGATIQKRGFAEGSIGYGRRYLGLGKRTSDAYVPGDGQTAKYQWADRLHMSADLALWLGRNWLASGRYRGQITLAHGALEPEENYHLLGPELHYRFDERIDMFAGTWSTASGKNTLHFDQFYLGLAFRKTKLNRLQGYLGGIQ